jgi:predicted phosphate transport protein (TIGR00153 family)
VVLARFLPRNERFFEYFRAAANNAAATARLLVDLVEHYEDVEQKVRRLRELEHRGDEITHQVFNALNRTFVTPLDREDIRTLASSIDDFVDAIEDVGKRLWLYRIERMTPGARSLAQIIGEQARVLAEAMPLMERPKDADSLKRQIVVINRLENEADDLLNTTLACLYDGADDIPKLIKAIRWGELYQELEEATDRAEDVANTLEGIMLKNA